MAAEPPSKARAPLTPPNTVPSWKSDGRRERYVATLSGRSRG
jgi:hypothetical protein